MKIYTKTGDKGLTGLVGGTRTKKSDPRIEAYGTVDELNSFIGLLAAYDTMDFERAFLENIQHKLFTVGSYLATDTEKVDLAAASIIHPSDIESIELEIDRLNETLPELRAFILPGGSVEGSVCHICRTVTRRAERRIISLFDDNDVDNHVVMYVNRLSDYFFTLSRYVTLKKGNKEILWKNQ